MTDPLASERLSTCTNTCPADQHLDNTHIPGTETDNTCVGSLACPVNTVYEYQKTRQANCPPCPANTYQDACRSFLCLHREPKCKPRTACGPGQFLEGSACEKGTCAPCSRKTFRSDATHFEAACRPHMVCSSTQVQVKLGTATADTLCESTVECTDQEYQARPLTNTHNRVCEALATCGPGKFVANDGTSATPSAPAGKGACWTRRDVSLTASASTQTCSPAAVPPPRRACILARTTVNMSGAARVVKPTQSKYLTACAATATAKRSAATATTLRHAETCPSARMANELVHATLPPTWCAFPATRRTRNASRSRSTGRQRE